MTSSLGHATLADEALVELSHQGDVRACEVLVARYRRYARHRSRGYFLLGGSRDDLEQEALIGLVEAVRDFRSRHGVSFRAFATLCMTRQMLAAIRSASGRRHDPLNASVSLDEPQPPATTPVSTAYGSDPADAIVTLDTLRGMRRAISTHTSAFERRVLALHLQGRTYAEIGAALGQPVKTVDNALQRTRRKVQPALRALTGAAIACTAVSAAVWLTSPSKPGAATMSPTR